MSMRFVTNTREDHSGRFDIAGSILSAVAIGALVLGIHEGPEQGWTSPVAAASLLVGVAAFAAFVWLELRHREPAVRHPAVPQPVARRRFGEPVPRVRRDVRHLPRAHPVPPSGARILGAEGVGRTAADGGDDDAPVVGRPDARQEVRHRSGADRRNAGVRRSVS